MQNRQHFLVFGPGSVGGYLSAKWSFAGHRVTPIVRRPFLNSSGREKTSITISENNLETEYPLYGILRFQEDLPTWESLLKDYFKTHDRPDWLVCTLKAHQLPHIALHIEEILNQFDVPVLTVVNGIPWWYRPSGLSGPLPSVDPNGELYKRIGKSRALGAVTAICSHIVSPGHVEVSSEANFILGEAEGGKSERLTVLEKSFENTGIRTRSTDDLVEHLWFKLLGNAAFNPLSVLVEIPQDEIAGSPALKDILLTFLKETASVAKAAGVSKEYDLEKRIHLAGGVGGHLTSTHQDFIKGNTLELGPLLGAVMELGAVYQVPTPHLAWVYTLVNEKSKWNLKRRMD